MPAPHLSLVLGGANSGKSAFAESLFRGRVNPLTYLATAQAHDSEMADKIAEHRARRGKQWLTIEEPFALAERLISLPASDAVLVDCLTMWLSNHLLADNDLDAVCNGLVVALEQSKARIVLVSNEVGLGIVPDNALARRFRSAQGRLNQQVAAKADLVVQVIAGLPLVLKGHHDL